MPMKKDFPPCDWCGTQLEPGKKPCSMLDDRTLFQVRVANNVRETCKAEVEKRK